MRRGAFDDIHGLKALLLKDHRQAAYQFAKVVFEYGTGTKPNLRQRLALLDRIPENAEDCRMKDLMVNVLMIVLEEG